jgi:hypothetical protein
MDRVASGSGAAASMSMEVPDNRLQGVFRIADFQPVIEPREEVCEVGLALSAPTSVSGSLSGRRGVDGGQATGQWIVGRELRVRG